MKNSFFQVFMLFKRKGETGVNPSNLLELNYVQFFLIKIAKKYAQMFNFQIPIEPLYLYQMFHPHCGYTQNIERNIEYEELLEFFNINLIATYEYLSGQS